MEDEEIYYDGQLPEVEVLSPKGAKKAYEKRVKQEMRKSKKDYKKMLSDYEKSSSEGSYLAELINHVSAHPESLFANNQRAADARRWLIDNDHKEVLDWAFDRSNPNARKLFNSKYLTEQSLTQQLIDAILEGQNKAGKAVGLAILAGASVPLLAETLPSVTSFATKAFWNPFSSMARGKSAQWGLNHIINPVLRKAGLGEMSQQALVGAGRVADIATVHIPAYKSTYNDIVEKVKGNRNWFTNKDGDFSLFNTVNTTTAPLFAFGAVKDVLPIAKAVSNTVKSVKPLARDVWSIARNNMTSGNVRLAYPWENRSGSVVDITDMQGNKAIDRTMKFLGEGKGRSSTSKTAQDNSKGSWVLETLPGYMIKSLSVDSKLGNQVSKQGTISLKNIEAWINKSETPAIDKELLGKVLETHKGEKNIDYNTLRKEIQELIPQYNRVSLTEYAGYGLDKLGLNPEFKTNPLESLDSEQLERFSNYLNIYKDRNIGEIKDGILVSPLTHKLIPRDVVIDLLANAGIRPKYDGLKLSTFTFESPGIVGNTKHYPGNPIGHSRTYTTADEPDVLHVMESLSDWALAGSKPSLLIGSNDMSNIKVHGVDSWNHDTYKFDKPLTFELVPVGHGDSKYLFYNNFALMEAFNEAISSGKLKLPKQSTTELYLLKTYLPRQLQENLRYAAENGLTKMRYPTSETAAKIEGYTRLSPSLQLIKALEKKYNRPEGYVDPGTRENFDFDLFQEEEALEFAKRFKIYEEWDKSQLAKDFWKEFNNMGDYYPQYKTILKKYADFPKLFLKLFKGLQVRVVTDSKGNTWYEVDVPKNYLNLEWQYKLGGILKTGKY